MNAPPQLDAKTCPQFVMQLMLELGANATPDHTGSLDEDTQHTIQVLSTLAHKPDAMNAILQQAFAERGGGVHDFGGAAAHHAAAAQGDPQLALADDEPIAEQILRRGQQAGAALSEDVRRKVLALLKKYEREGQS